MVRCDGEGTGTIDEVCPLGCSTTALRCVDPIPSNGLARFVELSSNRADLYLGESAKMNTDTGEILVGGSPARVDTELVSQPGGPTIRVVIARSVTAKDVVVSGTNALAIVSGGDIQIDGTFTVSARGGTPGPGSFYEEGCVGKAPPPNNAGGAGGGGFGSEGGEGGTFGRELGMPGPGGRKSGTDTLTPLRGGCDGGWASATKNPGAGGGAIQLFSRRQIAIKGILAASGGGGLGGGGSGGGILLEAPIVQVSGAVTANGGGGGGCDSGGDGRSDTLPTGGAGCSTGSIGNFRDNARGGNGAAGDVPANPGGSRILIDGAAGGGGGGFGRIRINTSPGGLRNTGIFSPNPSLGTIAIPQ